MTFANRSYEKELLDAAEIPFYDIKKNLQELNTINTLLGGHAITISGFRKLIGNRKKIIVCEIGCGGGDNLVAIKKWCDRKGIDIHCIGIDMKVECIQVAQNQHHLIGKTTWFTNDYVETKFESQPDIIFSSLFCHHFTNEALIFQLQWMKANAKIGFFINDLHRHPIAYYSIRILTKLFSNSYLVKHDAPLSVARGFVAAEWEAIGIKAGIDNLCIHWKWAFRHLIIYRNE